MLWIVKLQEAVLYLEAHLTEATSAEDAARAVGYAPAALTALFRGLTGYTPMEYLRLRRLSSAAQALRAGELSVTDAAFLYGYENVESFSRAFKRAFGHAPSQVAKAAFSFAPFAPFSLSAQIQGGFDMKRNMIPALRPVDWSDPQRQSEYINSLLSAFSALGETLSYDALCAATGAAFRTSFSKPGVDLWNPGNYHIIFTPPIIPHTFDVLGYRHELLPRGAFARDRQRMVDSIDRGVPVITLEGVINCSDACVIGGYDEDGQVLLGYNPFMDVEEDHQEAPDASGYFRKSHWHDGFFAQDYPGQILLIGEKTERPTKEQAFDRTTALIRDLILREEYVPEQTNGLAAHRAFARALMEYEWDDPFMPYLTVMSTYKQYLDRQFAPLYFAQHGRNDWAATYQQITTLVRRMGEVIPQDFSASDLFADKENLRPYADLILRIADLEEAFARALPT